jgi:hypothetical protein
MFSALKVFGKTTLLCMLPAFYGSTASAGDADLAKALANPLASLVSVPTQLDYNSGYGSLNGSQTVFSVLPVIPFDISDNWNLITRSVIPFVSQENISGASGKQTGLGDSTITMWFSPKATTAGGWTWGIGPVLYVPTSSDPLLGAGEWGAGPTAIALKQDGPWTFGAFGNHIWSFDSDAVNSSFVQPFVSYNTKNLWTYSVNSESAYDWNSEEWTVPVNFMVSKLVTVGDQPISLKAGARYYVDSPASGPDGWGARLSATFLFPKD